MQIHTYYHGRLATGVFLTLHSYQKNQRLTYNFSKEERLGRIEECVRGAGQMVTHGGIMVELREEHDTHR